ncbi:MAG: branched-chain amino acid transport system II carrier protein [Veillonella sp.]|uniref:branched-chain amino acid transport system II carrier protein n=1 Tax=Veillonella sp. TaxID=1926307 RepID=UPI00290D0E12|nr:branched-chain amino acid transport system II carrier protein [Veillonella sp.]MDU5003257.1 branched-chain amino acid transport system II carrier protein [Veillonella sp.]
MNGNDNLSTRAYLAIGMMLFALFFGAGNLIFPAALGQQAGSNVGWALLGFVLTGVGLPLLGVAAMGYSSCKDVEELASRVHPIYGLLYTISLYLSIGPMFATPRTGTVAYEIAIKPFTEGLSMNMEPIFLALFFGVSLWLSISPQKLVNRIGNILTPALLLVILLLIVKSFMTPLGGYAVPQPTYGDASKAVLQGFLDGYNTMDALASVVFAILVIDFVRLSGATSRAVVTKTVMEVGAIAVALLGIVYVFIANIGATSVERFGLFDTGAPVLSVSANYLFGGFGQIILAIIVLLACLSTSIGLITSCGTYFHKLTPKISYKLYVVIFSVAAFGLSMFGLKTIISAAIPVLMLLYPLTIVIILLALLHNVFGGRRCVYAWTMAFTMISALMTGLETAGIAPVALEQLFTQYIPFQAAGMGWVSFAVLGFVVGLIHKGLVSENK